MSDAPEILKRARQGRASVTEYVAAVVRLRQDLERPPAVPIEEAAELLGISVRTLYRRRSEFEHRRQNRHLYFTLRGIQEHIEIEQYNPSLSFNVTVPVLERRLPTPSLSDSTLPAPFGSNKEGPEANR